MTDKDIKDYCKNCDVESPAMRFKCPECEHNPDKEQIICKYKFRNKEKFDGKPYCTCFCELCEDLPICVHNCQIFEDYKKLARKTQECESLKEEIEILKDNFDTATRDCNELIEELRQECEELKGKYKNVLDLAKQNADANEYCL